MTTNSKPNRRAVLKGLGATGVAGLAGCAGGGGGGGDGGDTETEPAGTTTGGQSSLKEVVIASAPTPTTQLQMKYIREQTNILEGVFNEVGYDPKVQLTWDELSLFMGGKAHIAPSVGSIEAARLSVNQNQNLLTHAVTAPQHTGLYVRKGSDYDPEVAGSKQAAVDALASGDSKFGIGGWGLGTIPAYRLIFSDKYGYEFKEGGDFNVVTADFPALAQLVAKGKIDAGGSGPPYGLWPVRDKVKPLLWNQEELPDIGFPRKTIAIGNGVTRKKFAQNNEKAVSAYFGVLRRANEYLRDNIDTVAGKSATQETLHAPSKEAAKWILEFRLKAMHSPNKVPASPVDNGLTDSYIEQDKRALEKAASMGAIPENWGDSFGYMKHNFGKYYEMAKNYE